MSDPGPVDTDMALFDALPAPHLLVTLDGDAVVSVAGNSAYAQHFPAPRIDQFEAGSPLQPLTALFDAPASAPEWQTVVLGDRAHHVRVSPVSDEGARRLLLEITDTAGGHSELVSRVRQLQDLVDNSTALMYVKDLDGIYLIVNDYFARRFGVTPDDIVGRSDHDLFPTSSATVYNEHDQEVLRSGRSVEVEEPFATIGGQTDPDDDRRWLSIKFPLLDAAGRPYALGAISTDITDRKRAESAARAAMHVAEQANRSKSEFLSRISHELRTPLNAIIGFAQLIHDAAADPGEREDAAQILDSGRHLLSLVNDVLDITWIDAGAPGLTIEPVPAVEPIHDALRIIRPLARASDVEVASDLHDALHRTIEADSQRLRQVFLNLLSNAVKFNIEHGAVRVTCRATGGRLRYLVTDTGRGMAAAERDLLFTPFGRLSSAAGVEGTGLGLALSKRLVEEMGGRLEVEYSAPGEGTTFSVDLPLSTRTANPRPSAAGDHRMPPEELPGTILHIEDTYANLRLVESVLGRFSRLELLTATTGRGGLDLARERADGLDLILLDVNLADMNGVEVITALRADEATARIPIIVLSADATPERIDALTGLGIVDYLTKPIDIHQFVRAVRGVVG